jgi:hypothetical protein
MNDNELMLTIGVSLVVGFLAGLLGSKLALAKFAKKDK